MSAEPVGCVYAVQKMTRKKEKDSSVFARDFCPATKTFGAPDNLARFNHTTNVNHLLTAGMFSGNEQKIVRPIKSIRNKN
jgi:hypothetical protein